MSGGILQLVAYGTQDLYITGQPQITFFKTVYRRHTMFSMESIQQTFNGQSNLGNRITSTISRNGDLLHKLWVVATITTPKTLFYTNETDSDKIVIQKGSSFVKNVGYGLLKKVELEIGGQVIDRQYSDWLQVWSELTTAETKSVAGNELSGLTDASGNPTNFNVTILPTTDDDPFTGSSGAGNDIVHNQTTSAQVLTYISGLTTAQTTETKQLYIPLEFWFCRNVGLALPLIALQYHEVKVNIELASLTDLSYSDSETLATTLGLDTDDFVATIATGSTAVTLSSVHATNTKLSTVSVVPTGTPISGIELWADYIYLDVEERKRFAQVSHEYLIDQLQFVGSSSITDSATRHSSLLSFNHPVKELIWVFKLNSNQDKVGLWLSDAACPISSVSLKLNGHDRFAARPGKYFNLVQPFQHHSRCPPSGNGLYVYSFALKPEEHQPSGTCNFSRIDNAQLNFEGNFPDGTTSVCKVFATNYNILRILSGMGGIAYSN